MEEPVNPQKGERWELKEEVVVKEVKYTGGAKMVVTEDGQRIPLRKFERVGRKVDGKQAE
jgi:hypothetical protein